jgi:hypothetical protein
MQDPSKPIWFNKPKEYKKFSIFVATPVHSEVSIHFTQACLEFQKQCMRNNILVMFQLMKSSLVTQGRNLCVSAFMESNFSHLLFIDSDIDFQFESIMKMINADKEVISVPYPLKTFQWDKLYDLVKNNKIKSAEELSNRGYTYPFKVENNKDIKVDKGVIEVTHSPTGCMLIKRSVIERMIEAYPKMKIEQQTVINGELVTRPYLYNFFDTLFEPETRIYLGEDFAFCKRWKDIGGKCHAYILDYITHVGEHQYCGRFADELILPNKNDNITK